MIQIKTITIARGVTCGRREVTLLAFFVAVMFVCVCEDGFCFSQWEEKETCKKCCCLWMWGRRGWNDKVLLQSMPFYTTCVLITSIPNKLWERRRMAESLLWGVERDDKRWRAGHPGCWELNNQEIGKGKGIVKIQGIHTRFQGYMQM